MTRWTMVVLALALGAVAFAQPGPNPRQQPGAAVTMYAPEQHDLYDGHFVLSAGRLYLVGGLNDKSPWDHMDNAASTVRAVGGTAEIDVDEKANTGRFGATMTLPEGELALTLDRFHEFAACQDGGIVAERVAERKGNEGYNAATDKYEDLVKAGVIDPTKVTRTALQNAASVATLLLTSDALIAEAPKKDKKGGGGHGHGGSKGMMLMGVLPGPPITLDRVPRSAGRC